MSSPCWLTVETFAINTTVDSSITRAGRSYRLSTNGSFGYRCFNETSATQRVSRRAQSTALANLAISSELFLSAAHHVYSSITRRYFPRRKRITQHTTNDPSFYARAHSNVATRRDTARSWIAREREKIGGRSAKS